MINTTTVAFPLGYTISPISKTIDVTDIGNYLSAKKQRKYSSAIRSDQLVELTRHIWICPYCGEHIPAYPEYFNKPGTFKSIPKAELENWANLQLSFFDAPHVPLYLNEHITGGSWRCPRCDRESSPSNKTKKVIYTQTKGKLAVSVEVTNIGDLLSMSWLKGRLTRIAFPLYETVVFNFKKGKTFLKLHTEGGSIFAIEDISQKPNTWTSGTLHEALTCSKVNMRTFRRIFRDCYHYTFPVEANELSLEAYVLMTRFIGYPRTFYDAIPFVTGSWIIDRSFKHAAKALHHAALVPAVYEKTGLPKAKSIRRIFYENPGLLFYAEECVRLWELIADVNLFRRVLSKYSIFPLLSHIHLYPGVWKYYQDYSVIKGTKSLIDRLEKNWSQTNFDAVAYAAMNNQCRKVEQMKWKNTRTRMPAPRDDDEEEEERPTVGLLPQPITYSIPMHCVCKSITPCTIDGFSFTWLHNLNEYTNAGVKLKNCLKHWKHWQHPVVVVRQKNEIVAAIEVHAEKLQIIQAHTARNRYISEESALGQAYAKWRAKFGLEHFKYF